MDYKEILSRLKTSPFRAKFHLKKSDKDYVALKGMETIRAHAEDIIKKRLAPAVIPNDGKQTPMKNHPVFIAQHATATCCRGCLEKWHKIKSGKELSPHQIEFVVDLIMAYIESEMKN